MIEFKKLALLTAISFTLLYAYAYTLILSDVRKKIGTKRLKFFFAK